MSKETTPEPPKEPPYFLDPPKSPEPDSLKVGKREKGLVGPRSE
jgi:hypothetical protein